MDEKTVDNFFFKITYLEYICSSVFENAHNEPLV